MSRCKCCNAIIKRERVNPFTGEYEDLCSNCLAVSRQTAYNIDYESSDDDSEVILDILDWKDH